MFCEHFLAAEEVLNLAELEKDLRRFYTEFWDLSLDRISPHSRFAFLDTKVVN